MKDKDENSKNPRWKVPMDLPSVKPEDYDASIPSGRGSAHSPKGQIVSDTKPNDLSREEQKKRGQLPLHDEEIGGG